MTTRACSGRWTRGAGVRSDFTPERFEQEMQRNLVAIIGGDDAMTTAREQLPGPAGAATRQRSGDAMTTVRQAREAGSVHGRRCSDVTPDYVRERTLIGAVAP